MPVSKHASTPTPILRIHREPLLMPSTFGQQEPDGQRFANDSGEAFGNLAREDLADSPADPHTDDDPIRLQPLSKRTALSASSASRTTKTLPASHQPTSPTDASANASVMRDASDPKQQDASPNEPENATHRAPETPSSGASFGNGHPSRLVAKDADVAEEFLLGVINQEGESLSQRQRLENAQNLYNNTSGLYPRQRHYPTLEAMQRLNKIFGYVAIAIVFPYLIGRLFYLIYKTETGLMVELGRFSEFAIPVLFATVGLVGFLFAACEGIQLLIDVQDNLLRIANRSGRRKE